MTRIDTTTRLAFKTYCKANGLYCRTGAVKYLGCKNRYEANQILHLSDNATGTKHQGYSHAVWTKQELDDALAKWKRLVQAS